MGAKNRRNKQRSTSFVCELCADSKPTRYKTACIKDCTHSYCHQCIARFVISKLEFNVTNITCPVQGCKGVLNPDDCKKNLPEKVLHRWANALREKVIMESKTEDYFYCPFKDCSALLTYKKGIIKRMLKSKCSNCNRELCASCRVPWHTEFDCAKFQKLIKKNGSSVYEEQMVEDIAKKNNWRRCPNCKIYVEKTPLTCNHITCRCGYHFCYKCGGPFISHNNLFGSCPPPPPTLFTSRFFGIEFRDYVFFVALTLGIIFMMYLVESLIRKSHQMQEGTPNL